MHLFAFILPVFFVSQAAGKTAGQLCQGTAEEADDGNWYCSEVQTITYRNISQPGRYNRTTTIDPSTGLCYHEPVSYSGTGSRTPLFGELSMHIRGPMNISQLAVYTLSGSFSARRNRRRTLYRSTFRGTSTSELEHLQGATTKALSKSNRDGSVKKRSSNDYLGGGHLQGATIVWDSGSLGSRKNTSITNQTATVTDTKRSPIDYLGGGHLKLASFPPYLVNSSANMTLSSVTTTVCFLEPCASTIAPTTDLSAPTSDITPPPSLPPHAPLVSEFSALSRHSYRSLISKISEFTPRGGSRSSLLESGASIKPTFTTAVATAAHNPTLTARETQEVSVTAAGWGRIAYYTSTAPAEATGLAFLANLGDPRLSGTFDYSFGNSLSYVSSNGTSCVSDNTPFDGTLKTSEVELTVLTDRVCTGACDYTRPNSTAHHGWEGEEKAFFIEFQMDHYDNVGSDQGMISDAPAWWFLNANIPRTLQYGNDRRNIPCSCWSTGCGEFDAFEVLGRGEERAKSTIHRQGNLEGGDSNYFRRPVGRMLKFAVIFHNYNITAAVLDDDFDFGTVLSSDQIDDIVTYDPRSNTHSLFAIGT